MTGARYGVEYDPRAIKELSKLDRSIARRVRAAIEALADDPRPPGCVKLAGYGDLWRIKAAKDYRIIYAIEDAALLVLVVRVGHRGDLYDRL